MRFIYLLIIGLVVLCVSLPRQVAQAQHSGWQTPVEVSNKEITRSSWFPDLAVGRDGRVSIVWSSAKASATAPEDGVDLLMYRELNAKGWSPINNIAVPGTGGYTVRNSIVTGRDGKLHLLLRGHVQTQYMNAPWDHAWTVRAWSDPARVSGANGTYYSGLAATSDGALHAVWNEVVPENAARAGVACVACSDLFYRRSNDINHSIWSAPVNLSRSLGGDTKPQIVVDADQHLHVVWSEGFDNITGKGKPQTVVYRRSRDGGITWDAPVHFLLHDDTPQQIAIGLWSGRVPVIVYRGTLTNKLYYQISADNGTTWSQAAVLPELNARDIHETPWDAYTMVTDGVGNLHLIVVGVLSSEVDPKVKPRLFHLVWDGRRWSPPEVVVTDARFPEWPRAVVSGNRVHLTWFTRTDADLYRSDDASYQIWYSSTQIDGPALVAAPFFTPVPTPFPTGIPATSTPEPAPTMVPAAIRAPLLDGPPTWEQSGMVTTGIALAPVAALIALYMLLKRRASR